MTREEKAALKRYLSKLSYIKERGNNSFKKEDKDKRIIKAKEDYNFFVNTYFAHYATDKCAKFHIEAANRISKNNRISIVMEWARGHAKTTHLSLIIPLWLWIKEELKAMLCISSTYDMAKTLLSNIQAEFEANEVLINDFGKQVNSGSWSEGNFTTNNGAAFFARGRRQNLRGLKNKSIRIQYKVLDDVDSDDTSENPTLVSKAIKWIEKGVMNTGDKGIDRTVIVGNRIAKTSILSHFADQPHWEHIRINALKANGQPNWPEKYSKKYFEEKQKLISHAAFQTEFMNNPIILGEIFKANQFVFEKIEQLKDFSKIVGYWDEAYTGNTTSDYNAIVLLGLTPKGKYQLIDCYVRQSSPKEAIDYMYSKDAEFKSLGVNVYWIRERLIIDEPINQLFDKAKQQYGYYLPVVKDRRSKGNKFTRILSLTFYFEQSLISFNKEIENNKDIDILITQFLSIKEGSSAHDDGPDAFEGAISYLNGYFRTTEHKYLLGGKQKRKNNNKKY